MRKAKVAFICVHNSCRSQIAEALGKKYASDVFDSYSAGTQIKNQINQDAVRLMKDIYNIDMEKTQYSKLISDLPDIDISITMGCDVVCPIVENQYTEDLKELKQLLYSNEEVDLESLKNENNSEIEKISSVYGKNESFGIFIRSLVGLDREAINKEFSEFLNTEKFNSNQIELINLIIENIVKYGAYSKNEIPKLSNDILGKSIFNIFTNENDLQKIVDIIDKINSNAPKLL